MTDLRNREKAAKIVRDAGGTIVGRTKLQKIAYLLALAGYENGFPFKYRQYGPYSEDLSDAIHSADAFGLVTEKEKPTEWGGFYSTFKVQDPLDVAPSDKDLIEFTETLAKINSVELELAATAAFISAEEGLENPWIVTAERKPQKASEGRLEKAKKSYKALLEFDVPNELPKIA